MVPRNISFPPLRFRFPWSATQDGYINAVPDTWVLPFLHGADESEGWSFGTLLVESSSGWFPTRCLLPPGQPLREADLVNRENEQPRAAPPEVPPEPEGEDMTLGRDTNYRHTARKHNALALSAAKRRRQCGHHP